MIFAADAIEAAMTTCGVQDAERATPHGGLNGVILKIFRCLVEC
jgi:hypothetical protein